MAGSRRDRGVLGEMHEAVAETERLQQREQHRTAAERRRAEIQDMRQRLRIILGQQPPAEWDCAYRLRAALDAVSHLLHSPPASGEGYR